MNRRASVQMVGAALVRGAFPVTLALILVTFVHFPAVARSEPTARPLSRQHSEQSGYDAQDLQGGRDDRTGSTADGVLSGTVTDTTGLVLPGVAVEARSTTVDDPTRTVVTDAGGRFTFAALTPGTYDVTFTVSGFSTVARNAVEVTAGATITLDVEMAVLIEERVVVVGSRAQPRSVIESTVPIDAIPFEGRRQPRAAPTSAISCGPWSRPTTSTPNPSGTRLDSSDQPTCAASPQTTRSCWSTASAGTGARSSPGSATASPTERRAPTSRPSRRSRCGRSRCCATARRPSTAPTPSPGC